MLVLLLKKTVGIVQCSVLICMRVSSSVLVIAKKITSKEFYGCLPFHFIAVSLTHCVCSCLFLYDWSVNQNFSTLTNIVVLFLLLHSFELHSVDWLCALICLSFFTVSNFSTHFNICSRQSFVFCYIDFVSLVWKLSINWKKRGKKKKPQQQNVDQATRLWWHGHLPVQ